MNSKKKHIEKQVSNDFKETLRLITLNKDNSGNMLNVRSLSNQELSESQDNDKNRAKKSVQLFLNVFKGPLPFKSAKLPHLKFDLIINIESIETFILSVTEFQTINDIKPKIVKRTNIEIEEYAIYFNEKRLESSKMFITYKIKSKTEIILKKYEPVKIYAIYNSQRIDLEVYSGIRIKKLKKVFTDKIYGLEEFEIILKHRDVVLEDEKELFIYEVLENSEITIESLQESVKKPYTRGFQEMNDFFKMTNNLKQCKCSQIRIQAMSNVISLLINDSNDYDEELKKNMDFLSQIDTTRQYHHFDCFKLAISPMKLSCMTLHSIHIQSEFSFSGSDSSIKYAIFEENKKLEKQASLTIEDEFLSQLSQCKNFKEFEHLLKNKVGIKCNLTSVTLLYKYARAITRFIGFNENEMNPEIDKFLEFTNKYFKKYFKDDIVAKGGLDAFTLDVD